MTKEDKSKWLHAWKRFAKSLGLNLKPIPKPEEARVKLLDRIAEITNHTSR